MIAINVNMILNYVCMFATARSRCCKSLKNVNCVSGDSQRAKRSLPGASVYERCAATDAQAIQRGAIEASHRDCVRTVYHDRRPGDVVLSAVLMESSGKAGREDTSYM